MSQGRYKPGSSYTYPGILFSVLDISGIILHPRSVHKQAGKKKTKESEQAGHSTFSLIFPLIIILLYIY